MNLSKCSSTQVSTNPGPSASFNCTCVCCLDTTGPFVNVGLCPHVEVLKNLCRSNVNWKESNMVVCLLCHRMLDKINLFRLQAMESLRSICMRVDIAALASESKKRVNLLQQTETYIVSYYSDSDASAKSLDLDLNNTMQLKQEPLDIEIESYVSNDKVFIKEEYDSDENFRPMKGVNVKKENRNVKKNNKSITSTSTKSINKLKMTSNVENTLSDHKYRKIVDGEEHHRTMKLEPSEAEKQLRHTYQDKLKVIHLNPQQEISRRFSKDQKTWQCDDCKNIFSTRRLLVRHIRKVHYNISTGFPCKQCGKICKNLGSLGAHTALHRGKNQIKKEKKKKCDATHYCVECDKVFANKTTLKSHLKNSLKHINNDNDNRFPCEMCDRKFTDKKGLSEHIDFIHLNIKRYGCQHCDKDFFHSRALRRHINSIHLKLNTQIKDKICHICGKGFAANAKLTIHMRRHTGERPLSCDMCNANFAHPAALYTHRKLRHKMLPKKTLDGRFRTDCTVPHS